MHACERVSSHLHLIADEAAVAAEFRFRFYSSSSADLRQWSVWASMPLKTFFLLLVHVKKEHFVLQERENKQKCARRWQRWHSIFDCSEEESGKKNKDFGDSWHNTHTHMHMRAGASAHLLPRYWLLLGVRGYVFGPIEEKGNITSPVSIKSERQIGLHYCLGE